MKSLELSDYGLQCMSKQEQQKTDGGYWWAYIAACIFIYDAASDIRDGWNERKAEVEASKRK